MNVEETLTAWAARHHEVIALVLGGSRAKGTHLPHSDFDFGVQLEVEPTPEIAEALCSDLPLENPSAAKIFPLIERHFMLVGKSYKPLHAPEVTVCFTNIRGFIYSLENEVNHPLVDEMFEFFAHAKILYDPKGLLEGIKSRANLGWVRKRIVHDALALAKGSLDKFKKTRDPISAQFLKMDLLWNITRMIAGINKIPLGSRYDYHTFREIARAQGTQFIAPHDFFSEMEKLSLTADPQQLEMMLIRVRALAEDFVR
ncbi:nucleotidyltransferase domain-containing protein [Candidatus Woesearchaeota archaeon]|nr:nucleotidyltransferase domain-containing protein [Candidatus Woesearchaeota archaeon]